MSKTSCVVLVVVSASEKVVNVSPDLETALPFESKILPTTVPGVCDKCNLTDIVFPKYSGVEGHTLFVVLHNTSELLYSNKSHAEPKQTMLPSPIVVPDKALAITELGAASDNLTVAIGAELLVNAPVIFMCVLVSITSLLSPYGIYAGPLILNSPTL